jgi:predicted nucleic acid-binding protein
MILDTNAVSALFAGEPTLAEILSTVDRPHLPVIVIGEYRYGLLRSKHGRRLGVLLDSLIRDSIVLHVEEATTVHYAEVRNDLRAKGRPIPENDVWIAALARQHGLPVVTRDDHFEHVEGLSRLVW